MNPWREPSGKVVIYTTEYCSYCTAAKRLLGIRKIAYDEVHVPHSDDEAWSLMRKKSGMTTMPQIYSPDGKLVGGYDELAALDRQDQLKSLSPG